MFIQFHTRDMIVECFQQKSFPFRSFSLSLLQAEKQKSQKTHLFIKMVFKTLSNWMIWYDSKHFIDIFVSPWKMFFFDSRKVQAIRWVSSKEISTKLPKFNYGKATKYIYCSLMRNFNSKVSKTSPAKPIQSDFN